MSTMKTRIPTTLIAHLKYLFDASEIGEDEYDGWIVSKPNELKGIIQSSEGCFVRNLSGVNYLIDNAEEDNDYIFGNAFYEEYVPDRWLQTILDFFCMIGEEMEISDQIVSAVTKAGFMPMELFESKQTFYGREMGDLIVSCSSTLEGKSTENNRGLNTYIISKKMKRPVFVAPQVKRNKKSKSDCGVEKRLLGRLRFLYWMAKDVLPCECGGLFLVRRNRRDGNYFMGCSSYPDCKETKQMVEYNKARWEK